MILACNGLTNKHKGRDRWDKTAYKASCDMGTLKTNAWKYHSYPNQGRSGEESLCSYGKDCNHPEREKGRYASLRYAENYWQNDRKVMDRRRAFFCAAKVKEGGALMMDLESTKVELWWRNLCNFYPEVEVLVG